MKILRLTLVLVFSLSLGYKAIAQDSSFFWKNNNVVIQTGIDFAVNNIPDLNNELNTAGFPDISSYSGGLSVGFLLPSSKSKSFQEVHMSYSQTSTARSGNANLSLGYYKSGMRFAFLTIDNKNWNTYPFLGFSAGVAMLTVSYNKSYKAFQTALSQPFNSRLVSNYLWNGNAGWQFNRALTKEKDDDLIYLGVRVEASYPINKIKWKTGRTSYVNSPRIIGEYLKLSILAGYR